MLKMRLVDLMFILSFILWLFVYHCAVATFDKRLRARMHNALLPNFIRQHSYTLLPKFIQTSVLGCQLLHLGICSVTLCCQIALYIIAKLQLAPRCRTSPELCLIPGQIYTILLLYCRNQVWNKLSKHLLLEAPVIICTYRWRSCRTSLVYIICNFRT